MASLLKTAPKDLESLTLDGELPLRKGVSPQEGAEGKEGPPLNNLRLTVSYQFTEEVQSTIL